MRYLVAYDIKDDKRRTKVFKILKGYGYSVQYSIFEIPIHRNDILKKLQNELQNTINPEEDVIYIFPSDRVILSNKKFRIIFQRGNSF